MKLDLPSCVTSIVVDGREFLIKRDDLLHPLLSGNKFRKLYALVTAPATSYKRVISYGGTQSNAMLSIAALCHYKGWEFIYYTKPLSKVQKDVSHGNYFEAMRLGMKHIEISHESYKESISSLRVNFDEQTFIVDQGGALQEADLGLRVLADEIKTLEFDAVATPSGTGTTALFLAHNLPHKKIYTVPCVGDVTYLEREMAHFGALPKNLAILEPKKKYHFAKPYPEFYHIYKKLKDAGVEFDLAYAPLLWQELLAQTDEKILYVHSGGVMGNSTLLQRYKQKGIC